MEVMVEMLTILYVLLFFMIVSFYKAKNNYEIKRTNNAIEESKRLMKKIREI